MASPNEPTNTPTNAPTTESMEKLDAIAQEVVAISPEQEIKRRIIRAAKSNMNEYYDRYPERALDERGRDNQEKTVQLIQHILSIIDDYKIDGRGH